LGKAVVISGTPGTGKTSVALKLSKLLKAKYLNLSDLAIRKGLIKGEDIERETFVIDEGRVTEVVATLIKLSDGTVVIDSHYGELIPDYLVLKIFVLRTHPAELLKRLRRKGYPDAKIRENLEAELTGVCVNNALSLHPQSKVCEVDTTSLSIEEVAERIVDILEGRKECVVGIDWLSSEIPSDVLSFILSGQNPD